MRVSTIVLAFIAGAIALPSPDAVADIDAMAVPRDALIDDGHHAVLEERARDPGWTKKLAAKRCKYGDCNHDCTILVKSCFNMANGTDSSGMRGPPVMLRRVCRSSYRACEQSCYDTCFEIEQNYAQNSNSTGGSCSGGKPGGKPKGGNN